MKHFSRTAVATLGLALWSLACSDTPNTAPQSTAEEPGSTTPVAVAKVSATPDTVTLQAGQTRQLSAATTDAAGHALTGRTVAWASSATAIATVSNAGLVTAVAQGQARVTATSEGKTDTVTVTVAQAATGSQVATIAVTAPSASVQAGSTLQATATARSSANAVVSGVAFTWSSSSANVATVSANGLVSGVAAGSATITATAAGTSGVLVVTVTAIPAPPVSAGGAPNPTALPVAQPNHAMNVSAYQSLNVSGMAAGASYRDPVTSVRITKLTSSSFPGGGSWGHDYFEGGSEVSDPYTSDGVTRAVKAMNPNGAHILLDVIPGSGVSKARALSGNLSPNHDLGFTFSINPSTPYYAYVLNGSTLRRMDVRTMTEAPGGGFPRSGAGTDGGWLQQCANDAEFVWMAGSTIYHYTPATGTLLTRTNTAVNEPRFDRGCRYVGFSMDSPENGLQMWDTQSNTVTWTSNGTIPFAHQATLQHMWVANDWNGQYPFPFVSVTPTANSFKSETGPSVGDFPVGNGQWMQSGDQRNAYTVWNSYGSLSGKANFPNLSWTAPGGIVLVTMNGDKRLLAHPYSNQGSYFGSAWPKFSADGKVVLFTSDMMGGRYDLFLIEMPLR